MKVQLLFIGFLAVFLIFLGWAKKSEAVKVVSEIAFAADFGNEPGKVMIANVITKGQTANDAGSVANLVFRVKFNFYGESLLNPGEISVADGAHRLNVLRDVAPLSLMITPDKTELVQNYPNPFNQETKSITAASDAVRSVPQRAGRYIVNWNGQDENGRSVASGIYFYRISAGDFQSVKRMLMLK